MSLFPICLHPWTSLEIDDGSNYFGHVQPCCWAVRRVGDTKTHSISEIWNGPGYVDFREHMLSGDLDGYCPPTCPSLMPSSVEIRWYLAHLAKYPNKNHFLNLTEILQKATTLRSVPLYLKITPTLACNLRCIMCFQTHDTQTQLSEEALEDMFNIFPRAKVLRIQGGELFASPKGLHFIERLGELKRQPQIGLITNGTFPISKGWELLERLSLRWVVVSIDAATRNTYEQIRLKGDWENVVGNIEKLCTLGQIHKPKFKVHLSMTLMTVNYKELKEFVVFASELGADVVINFLTSAPPPNKKLAILKHPEIHRDVRACLQDALSYAEGVNMSMAQNSLRTTLDILKDSPSR